MAKTMEELESMIENLTQQIKEMPTGPTKEVSELREEIIKIQSLINKSDIPTGDKKIIKEKIRRLKEKPFWKVFDEDEYEEIEIEKNLEEN
jgi:hypothetical protein